MARASKRPSRRPSRKTRKPSAKKAPRKGFAPEDIPPEWKALLDASSEIEKENREEREKNRNLALQLTRLQFENEVLSDQREASERRIRELEACLEARAPIVQVKDPQVESGMQAIAEATEERKYNAHQARLIRLASALTREVVYLSELYRLRSRVKDPETQALLLEFENLIEQGYEAVCTAERLSRQEAERKTAAHRIEPQKEPKKLLQPPPFRGRINAAKSSS